MLEQTINGKHVTIIHNAITNTYFVLYERGIVEMDQRPMTDQDVQRIQIAEQRINDAQQDMTRIIAEQRINEQGTLLGNILINLMEPLLYNRNDPNE